LLKSSLRYIQLILLHHIFGLTYINLFI
jgi:hypothetical protein